MDNAEFGLSMVKGADYINTQLIITMITIMNDKEIEDSKRTQNLNILMMSCDRLPLVT